MSRIKERLFHNWPHREDARDGKDAKDEPPARLPAIKPQRQVGFPASIAEFLLVFRLKARRRSTLSADILERAVRVVFVTCKNWFAGAGSHHPKPRRHD
ncbi:hypothetical protein [Polaromonas sp.]|uniref:hypothetical protein n=1 Tax=Polaromonas sp. TaxID=1869339 RepID=UPI001A25CA0B|nr:hypothetical protein [Burkholderiales bacterium]